MNPPSHPDTEQPIDQDPITDNPELADLDAHMQTIFAPDIAPDDLADRTLARLNRPRLNLSFLKHPLAARAPLALAATVALATTGYYAQSLLDPSAHATPSAMLASGVVNGRDRSGQNVRFADGHADWKSDADGDGLAKASAGQRAANGPTAASPVENEGVLLGDLKDVKLGYISKEAGRPSEPGTGSNVGSALEQAPWPNNAPRSRTDTASAPASSSPLALPEAFKPGDKAKRETGEVYFGGNISGVRGKDVNGERRQVDKKLESGKFNDNLLAGGEVAIPGQQQAGGGGVGGAGQQAQGQGQQVAQPPAEAPALSAQQKVIRSGTIVFEVDSFDSSLMTVTKLVMEDGGFIASTDSSKLPNGKTRGMIVVRVPPDRLDAFVLKLRGMGDLKSQQIAAQDVGKQYTDIESQLKAARAMEGRLLDMIAKGQGAIKELLAAEKELGTWREKIEKLEGEKRYFDNLISMSTLQITLQERDIKAAAGAIETEQVNAGVETDDVLTARTQLLKAIDDAKGRVLSSDLNQLQGGQLAASVTAEVPAEQAGAIVDRLKQLGRVARLDVDRKQTTVDGSAPPTPGAHVEKKATRLIVSLYNLANVAPRTSVTLNLAAADVEQSYRAAIDRITKAGGRVIASSLSRPGDTNVVASINFETAAVEADAVAGDLRALGDVTRLQQTDNPDQQNTTLAKRGFAMQIVSLAQVQPREALVLQIAAKDVSAAYQKLLSLAQKDAVRITQSTLEERDRANLVGRLDAEMPAKVIAEWEQQLGAAGDTLTRNSGRLADGENVVDSKTRYTLTLLPADRLPARKSTSAVLKVENVDTAAADVQLLAEQVGGRVVDASVSRDPGGRSSSRVIVDVPLARQGDVLTALRKAGETTTLSTSQSMQAPDGALGRARFELTFTAGESLVGAEDGFWASIVRGFSTSLRGLAWSVQLIVIGLCLVAPWVLILWAGWKFARRRRVRAAAVA